MHTYIMQEQPSIRISSDLLNTLKRFKEEGELNGLDVDRTDFIFMLNDGGKFTKINENIGDCYVQRIVYKRREFKYATIEKIDYNKWR